MKLLQLNIWMGRLLRQVTDFVAAEKPDILCLQEVCSSGDIAIKTPDEMFSSLEIIQQTLGYEHSFFSPTLAVECEGVPISFGNAIISKYPLHNQQTIFVAGEFSDKLDITIALPNIRNLQIAQIDSPDGPITIANHHGYWLIDPLGDQTTIDCLQMVADKLHDTPAPIILAGDLNVVPASPAMRVFDDFLEDLTETYKLKSTLSQLGKAVDVPCDHILVSPEIQAQDFRVNDRLVSDHQALLLEFALKN